MQPSQQQSLLPKMMIVTRGISAFRMTGVASNVVMAVVPRFLEADVQRAVDMSK